MTEQKLQATTVSPAVRARGGQKATVTHKWCGLYHGQFVWPWVKRRRPHPDDVTREEMRAIRRAVAGGEGVAEATAAVTSVPLAYIQEMMSSVVARSPLMRAAGAVAFYRSDVRESGTVLPCELVSLFYSGDERYPEILCCNSCFAHPAARHHEGCELAPAHAAVLRLYMRVKELEAILAL